MSHGRPQTFRDLISGHIVRRSHPMLRSVFDSGRNQMGHSYILTQSAQSG